MLRDPAVPRLGLRPGRAAAACGGRRRGLPRPPVPCMPPGLSPLRQTFSAKIASTPSTQAWRGTGRRFTSLLSPSAFPEGAELLNSGSRHRGSWPKRGLCRIGVIYTGRWPVESVCPSVRWSAWVQTLNYPQEMLPFLTIVWGNLLAPHFVSSLKWAGINPQVVMMVALHELRVMWLLEAINLR